MRNAKRLSFSRHVEIGQQLHATIEFLHSLRRELRENASGKYASQAGDDIDRTIRRLDIMRNTMENLLCTSGAVSECDRNPCNVYYGPFGGDAK